MGIVTDPKCYERIEFVYMNSDKFQTKQDIAEFYKEKEVIKQYLADTMHQIFKDKTVVKMLSEYRTRSEKEFDELKKKFEWAARDGEKQMWGASCLTHSDSYKEVIADMTYNGWLHKHADDFK